MLDTFLPTDLMKIMKGRITGLRDYSESIEAFKIFLGNLNLMSIWLCRIYHSRHRKADISSA